MSDCKQSKVIFQFNLVVNLFFLNSVLILTFTITAEQEKCQTCGSLTPKKSKKSQQPEEEPRTPSKESPKLEEKEQKKVSAFQRLGSFLRKKQKDDSSSKK